MSASLKILTGDCRVVLPTLAAESVHCCVTSPPYWGLRSYLDHPHQIGLEVTFQAYIETLVGVFEEVRRILRKDGTLWLNLGDSYCGSFGGQSRGGPPSEKSTLQGNGHVGGGPKLKGLAKVPPGGIVAGGPKRTLDGYQIRAAPPIRNAGARGRFPGLKPKDLVGIPWRVALALQAAGWYLRSDIIWAKPAPMPESVPDRPTKSHEYIFLLSKSRKYYYAAAAISEPVSGGTHARVSRAAMAEIAEHRANGLDSLASNPNGYGIHPKAAEAQFGCASTSTLKRAMTLPVERRNKRTVWTVPSDGYEGSHFATFPPNLIKPAILAGCPPGGLVLDPFLGSGTTAAVALELGRRCVGIELVPEYVALAGERTAVTLGMAI